MAGGSSNTQTVFLIDVSSSDNTDSKWNEAISLSVFRVLCYLNSQTVHSNSGAKPSKQQLRWGYKFFHSDGKKQRAGGAFSSFREFKLRHFEEFEKNFRNVLESDPPVRTRSQQEQKPARKSSAAITYPALSLSKSLTEIVHDFQWEMPDIGSPVKTRKSSISQPPGNGGSTNLVFLFTKVPVDRKALRHFCNKVVMDADVFTESVMSPMLQKEFCVHRKIRLFWIDTGRYCHPDCNLASTQNPPDENSFDLVKQSVQRLGGNLLMFDALVTHLPRTKAAVNQQDLDGGQNENDSSQPAASLNTHRDIVTELSRFSCTSVCSSLVLNSSKSHDKAGMGCFRGGCRDLQSMFSDVHMSLQDSNGSVDNVPLLLTSVTGKTLSCEQSKNFQASSNLQTASSLHAVFGVSSHLSVPTAHDHGDGHQGVVLRPCANVGRTHSRMLSSSMMDHFLCHLNKDVTPAGRQKFLDLLRAVLHHNQCLVLSVHSGGVATPYLVLLEAVSQSSAQISVLSLTATLQVEKMISLQNQFGAKDDSSVHVSLEEFKQKAVAAMNSQHAGSSDSIMNSADVDRVGRKFSASMLNPWHSPACVPHLEGALSKLKERIGNMDYLCDAEKTVLLDLQSLYRQEDQPPLLLQPPFHSTPVVTTGTSASQPGSKEWMNTSGESNSGSQSRPGLSRQSSLLARGLLMVTKAKRTSSFAADEVDGEFVPSSQTDAASRADVSHLMPADLRSREDLQKFVQEQYQQSVNSGLGLEMTAQSLVTVTQHFMSTQQDQTQPQSAAVQFLKQNVSKTSKDLKTEYQSLSSEEDQRRKVTEYKLQVLLHLEIESVCADSDDSAMEQTANEIVDLLRGLLFISEPGAVPKFLNTTVISSYSATLPQLLVNVYEELMQPLPPNLAEFTSPGTTSSVMPEPLSASSQLSCAPNSDPSSIQSNPSLRSRTRSLRPHPSLIGLGSKRQIVVETKAANKKSKTESRPKAADGHKSSRHKVKAEVKGARRNLFDTGDKKKADKRHSQHSRTETAKKSAKRSTPRKKLHRSMVLSPCGSRSAPHKVMVAETPHHQRQSRTSWLQQQSKNQQAASDAQGVQVVEESPVKACTDLKTSPGRYKPAMRIMRKAFYSGGQAQRSRNLARALELSDRIAGRQHHRRGLSGSRLSDALSGGSQEEIMSPTHQASAFLRAQLMRSPSPKQATPTKSQQQQPDFTSPSQNTRSKTPQRLSVPRLHLFQDGEETPSSSVSSPAVAALHFTSPVKRQSTSLVAETPPRLTRSQSATLVVKTPTKVDVNFGHTTPKKGGTSSAGLFSPNRDVTGSQHCTTPKRGRNDSIGHVTPKRGRGTDGFQGTSLKKLTGHLNEESPSKLESSKHQAKKNRKEASSGCVTPKKCKVRTTLRTDTGQVEVISPSKQSRRISPGPEPQGVSLRHKSPETQRTILDYISSRSKSDDKELKHCGRTVQTAAQEGSVLEYGQRTPTRSATRVCLGEKLASPGTSTQPMTLESPQRNQIATDSSRMSLRSGLLSPVHTPTKLAFSQQFSSPSKTPTKPILKNSPSVHTLSSPSGSMEASCTPQKSPRVTFDIHTQSSPLRDRVQSPSASSSRTIRTPDLDKWPRKKRRWPSDSKSPSSQSPLKSSSTSSSGSDQQKNLSPTESMETKSSGSWRTSVVESTASSTKPGSRTMRKRGPLFSNLDSVSSPSKRHRTETAGKLSSVEPSVYSDNAMDSPESYFSASNDDVFLSSSSSSQRIKLSGSQEIEVGSDRSSQTYCRGSPLFKSRARSSKGLKRCKSSFADEGSQGFEIRSQESKPPASPTFSTSPVMRQSRTKAVETQSCTSHGQMTTEPESAGPSSAQTQARPLTPVNTDKSPPCSVSNKLTPLRIKGTPTERKFSPTVSTTSLVHLMNSPILFDNPKHSKPSPESSSSPTKHARKRSRKMLQLQD